jgi:hypothetical protein
MALDTSSFDRFFGVVVGETVMETAEETQVVHGGFATVGPVDVVVDVTPAGGTVASLVGAVPVSGNNGSAKTGGDDPGLATHVEDLGTRAEDDSADGRVAGELADRVDGEYMSALGLMETTRPALEGVEVDVDVEMGFLPTHLRGFGFLEKAATQVF